MAFAGIFQPSARLRWIRFGLLIRQRKFSRRFSIPQYRQSFRRMGEGCGRAATGDARGVADEEARSRKASEGICGKVTSELFPHDTAPSYLKIGPQSLCARDCSSTIYQIVR